MVLLSADNFDIGEWSVDWSISRKAHYHQKRALRLALVDLILGTEENQEEGEMRSELCLPKGPTRERI